MSLTTDINAALNKQAAKSSGDPAAIRTELSTDLAAAINTSVAVPEYAADPAAPTAGQPIEYFNTTISAMKRWNGIRWKLKEPIYVHLQEFDRNVNVATGTGKKFFLVPDEWNGLKITEVTVICPNGTGDVNVETTISGTSGTLINVTGNTSVNVGANRALSTGNHVAMSILVNSGSLQGLAATYKIE